MISCDPSRLKEHVQRRQGGRFKIIKAFYISISNLRNLTADDRQLQTMATS